MPSIRFPMAKHSIYATAAIRKYVNAAISPCRRVACSMISGFGRCMIINSSENSTLTLEWINKGTAPERGLGLKVVRQGQLCHPLHRFRIENIGKKNPALALGGRQRDFFFSQKVLQQYSRASRVVVTITSLDKGIQPIVKCDE